MSEPAPASDRTHIRDEVRRRRVIAIISHPDAGKTTLTERLLTISGTINQFGMVKARGGKAAATSDWMEMERQRGISITSTVLRFTHRGTLINLIDTPGHADFSEDTYRALAAVDAAVMVVDAAKGVEDRTRKLFDVCRTRRVPILVLINKVDRPALDPLELLEDLHSSLNIAPAPSNWPVGEGPQFAGLVAPDGRYTPSASRRGSEPTDQELVQAVDNLRLARDVFGDVTREHFLAAEVCPVHFGSALRADGVAGLLDDVVDLVPAPSPRQGADGTPRELTLPFSGFVFKIQSNQDPRHRDRIAFIRVCSGAFARGMRARNARSGASIAMQYAHLVQAGDRTTADHAFPGDVVGLVTTGDLVVGDTLYDGLPVEYPPIPTFAPELLRVCVNTDSSKRKQYHRGLTALADEGVVQVFETADGAQSPNRIVGAAGALQFEVLSSRLEGEYGVAIRLDPFGFDLTRATDEAGLQLAADLRGVRRLRRRDGAPFLAFDDAWRIDDVRRKHPDMQLRAIVE